MMKFLALVSLLCAQLSLTNAQCYIMEVTSDMTHCKDPKDGTWHEVGSSWRSSDCMDCTCSQCCYAYFIPKLFPEDCMSVFNPTSCEYVVHKKDDPTVLCDIFAAVGK